MTDNNELVRILFIEDDPIDQRAFFREVKQTSLPYSYSLAGSVREAKDFIGKEIFDLIICDYNLPDGTGLEVIERATQAKTPLILITGQGNEEIAVAAMKQGAVDYLVKDEQRLYLKVLPFTVKSVLSRKSEERKRRWNEMLLEQITGKLPFGICVTDIINNKILYCNNQFTQIWHMPYNLTMLQSGSIGFHTLSAWCASQVQREQDPKQASYQGEPSGAALPVGEFILKTGPALRGIVQSIQTDSETRALLYLCEDVSERKRAEQIIMQYNRQLVMKQTEMNRKGVDQPECIIEPEHHTDLKIRQLQGMAEQKEAFVTQIADDLKRPLSQLIAKLPLIIEKVQDSDNRALLDQFNTHMRAMHRVLDQVFSLKGLGHDQTGPSGMVWNLNELLQMTIKSYSVQISKKGVSVKTTIPEGTLVWFPKMQAVHVFGTIISNAVKFSNQDGIISISSKEDDGFVTISITDTGLGMDVDQITHIWDDQYQTGSSDSHESGITLYIIKRIIMLYGGAVSAISPGLGKGTTLTVRFPSFLG